MATYKVAHVRHQGVNLIIAPLDSAFERAPANEQHSFINQFQVRANSAGLAGTVVPVWQRSNGAMAFIAPPNWHPFFQSINLNFVHANINQEIRW